MCIPPRQKYDLDNKIKSLVLCNVLHAKPCWLIRRCHRSCLNYGVRARLANHLPDKSALIGLWHMMKRWPTMKLQRQSLPVENPSNLEQKQAFRFCVSSVRSARPISSQRDRTDYISSISMRRMNASCSKN